MSNAPTFLPAGDLFTLGAEAIVNPVNCVGKMGKGLALTFKNMYPENFRAYAAICARRELKPGGLFPYKHPSRPDPWILNVATKNHWRDHSNLDDVQACAQALVDFCRKNSIRTVACPALGAGNGRLPWDTVRAVLELALVSEHTEFTVFLPQGPTPADTARARRTGFGHRK